MSLAKRIAETADPHIRPYQLEDGREYFVAFHGARSYRDLKADATIVAANKDARAREGSGMDKNPLFQDGDIIYDGIIHRKVPEIDALCTALGGFDAQGRLPRRRPPRVPDRRSSRGIAWGQEPTFRTDTKKDYRVPSWRCCRRARRRKEALLQRRPARHRELLLAAAADSSYLSLSKQLNLATGRLRGALRLSGGPHGHLQL
jgi:hypothetical protein